ncbi:class I SAM-dependent methyltransferase [Kribbella qitaiheensis]|uniref:class I SAM-dependent methyltransferase n=1 Tax=Kribbella qitaiheensis TaxID=1544730 RepID=UPI00361D5A1D
MLAGVPVAPPRLVATESSAPNLEIARRNLAPHGASVVSVEDWEDLPFDSSSFDLVISRHPTVTMGAGSRWWNCGRRACGSSSSTSRPSWTSCAR